MRITNTQKKELSDIFREFNLNISEFETSGQYKEFKVKYKYEYYSFSINIQKIDNFYLTIFPVNDTKGFSVGATWEQTKQRFSAWAKQISTELNTPTGWEAFDSENFLDSKFSDIDDEFTDSEKVQIRQSINDLKARIQTLELPQLSLDTIAKKLDDLTKKVDSLSKFDWKSLFIGTIASLILTLVIPPDTNGMIWEYVKIAFGRMKIIK
ncbi:MAG TPA: hypothetical protein PKO30_15240 [Prolixibacteraceae bacterium]|nr:hypothetical protein [Prolixibacteraceae bacterium]